MKRLSIKNVGPISDVDAVMNRFNFFIGPQSSGKSTIAKIFSTCSWIEKEVATTFNEKSIEKVEDFVAKVVDFHKMDTYFNESSEIHFQTDIVKIDLADGKFSVQLLDKSSYNRKKYAIFHPSVMPSPCQNCKDLNSALPTFAVSCSIGLMPENVMTKAIKPAFSTWA